MINMRKSLFTLVITTLATLGFAQEKGQPVDKVIAVVGGSITLQSELETQYLQMLSSVTTGHKAREL